MKETTTLAQGQAALMLCECMIHLLVERHILDKAEVVAAIDGIVDIKREMAEEEQEDAALAQTAIGLLRSVAQSLAAIEPD